MPRAVPSSSRRERRSSQLPAPGQASPSSIAASSNPRLAGLIMQFPSLNELRKPLEGDLGGCYNHPCVILSPVLAADGVVTVLPMTSFGEHHIHVKFPLRNQANMRAQYLPVAPAPAHPDTGELLRLGDPRRMRKDSYVNTERPHPGIPFAVLRPFHGRDGAGLVLSVASYRLVVERAGFAAPLAPPPRAPASRPTAPASQALEWGPGPSRPGYSARPAVAPAPAARNPAHALAHDGRDFRIDVDRNPAHVLAHDARDFRIDVDRLRQSRPRPPPPPPSYGTVAGIRPPRRAPAWAPARGGGETFGGYSGGGAAGTLLPPGWVSQVVKFVLFSGALFLAGYGVYWGAVKSIEMAQLCWAWVKNGGGAIAEAARGALRGLGGSLASAGDGVRGAWESVVGWVRRAVGSLHF